MQGFRVKDLENQTEMKASEVHRSMGLKNLLDLGLFFKEENFNLNNTMQKLNQVNSQKLEKDWSNAEKKNNSFSSSNIFAPSFDSTQISNQIFKNVNESSRAKQICPDLG